MDHRLIQHEIKGIPLLRDRPPVAPLQQDGCSPPARKTQPGNEDRLARDALKKELQKRGIEANSPNWGELAKMVEEAAAAAARSGDGGMPQKERISDEAWTQITQRQDLC